MTTPAENQNWQKRQYDSFGPHFRIETANPELGIAGNIAYNLYGYSDSKDVSNLGMMGDGQFQIFADQCITCLLYTSPSPRDRTRSRMPSSA